MAEYGIIIGQNKRPNELQSEERFNQNRLQERI